MREFENVFKRTCNKVQKTFDENKVTQSKARSRRKIILQGNDRHKLWKSKAFHLK